MQGTRKSLFKDGTSRLPHCGVMAAPLQSPSRTYHHHHHHQNQSKCGMRGVSTPACPGAARFFNVVVGGAKEISGISLGDLCALLGQPDEDHDIRDIYPPENSALLVWGTSGRSIDEQMSLCLVSQCGKHWTISLQWWGGKLRSKTVVILTWSNEVGVKSTTTESFGRVFWVILHCTLSYLNPLIALFCLKKCIQASKANMLSATGHVL